MYNKKCPYLHVTEYQITEFSQSLIGQKFVV